MTPAARISLGVDEAPRPEPSEFFFYYNIDFVGLSFGTLNLIFYL